MVKLVAPAQFKSLIETSGITFVSLAGDPTILSQQLNDSGNNFLMMIHAIMNHAIRIGADVLQKSEEACGDAHLMIHTFMHAIDGVYPGS